MELLAEQVCGWRLKVSDECLPRAPKTSADRWHTRSDRRLQKDGASGARKIDVGFEGIASAWRDPFCQLAVVLRSLVVLACDLSRGRGRRSAGLWRSGMIGRLDIGRSWAQCPRRLANEGWPTKAWPRRCPRRPAFISRHRRCFRMRQAQAQSIQRAGLWRSDQGNLTLERQTMGSSPATGISQVPPPPSIHFPSPPLFLNTPRRGPVISASWVMAEWSR